MLRICTITLVTIAIAAGFLTMSRASERKEALNPTHTLVLTLTTADLESEAHELPSIALRRFSDWMKHVLKKPARKGWTVHTVRKAGGLDFVHAEAEGLAIRQVREVIAVGFARPDGLAADGEAAAIGKLLKEHVQGDWGAVKVSLLKKTNQGRLLGTPKSFEQGTSTDCFLARVGDDRIWVVLPKRLALGGQAAYSFSLDGNRLWFDDTPGKARRTGGGR